MKDQHQDNDIITDCLHYVRAALVNAPHDTVAKIDFAKVDEQVRKRWEGERPYIAKRPADSFRMRDGHMLAAWRRGERVAFLASQHNISPRSVQRAIDRALEKEKQTTMHKMRHALP
jgi:Mor family transcriptional regulator